MDAGCAVLFLVVCHIAACDSSGIILRPAEDTILANNSPDNITYTCETPAEDVTLLWVVRGEQIWSESQVDRYARNGVFMENQGSSLSLVVTPEGRRKLNAHQTPISIKCSSFYANEFKVDATSEELEIIQFDAPGPVVGLQLTYTHVSDPETELLTLQWDRPEDTYEDVNIFYDVTVDNMTIAQISETYVSVSQNTEEMCQQHIFSVTARNSAGSSPTSDIVESIPISPDVDALNAFLKVLLINNSDVNISISFQHATTCNDGFPVLNYTLEVGGRPVAELNASDYTEDTVSVTISSLEIPTLALGQQYSVIITACNKFTCRSTKTSLVVVTGDVQTASVIFYKTSVMVECTLAEGSTASGCLLVFTRFSDNETENVTDRNPTGRCPQLTQTKGAYYAEETLVYAIAYDNSTVIQPVTVSLIDSVDTNNFTCVLEPTVQSRFSEDSEESKASSLSTDGKIGIAVVGALVGIVLAGVFLAVVYRCYKNKTKVKEDTDGIPLQEQYIHIGVLRRSNGGVDIFYDNKDIIQQVQKDERPIFWKKQ